MNRDPFTDAISLLVFWWRYERNWTPVEGYPVECPSTRGWHTSRQYDDMNGAQETDGRGQLAKDIGHIVNEMDEPYRTALYVLARNRATGVAVWRSPRLPENEQERMKIVAEAIDRFFAKV